MKFLSLSYMIWPHLLSFSSLRSSRAGLPHHPQGLPIYYSFYLDPTSLHLNLGELSSYPSCLFKCHLLRDHLMARHYLTLVFVF